MKILSLKEARARKVSSSWSTAQLHKLRLIRITGRLKELDGSGPSPVGSGGPFSRRPFFGKGAEDYRTDRKFYIVGISDTDPVEEL